jgi:predicted transcriptional regulator
MNARDVMTTKVVSVSPDSSLSEIAKLLLDRGISAAPVVDADGVPLGMVSEGDLIGRDETTREARRDWWLSLLAEGEPLHPEFLASLQSIAGKARDVMSAPLVTVGEETGVDEIAKLLATHHIKRVPVLRDGHIVGIVSRADLLRALIAEPTGPVAAKSGGFLAGVFGELDDRFLHRSHPAETPARLTAADQTDKADFSVGDFQNLQSDFKRKERQEREARQRAVAERNRRTVADLIDQHISDESWRALLHDAREAAERGEKRLLLLRFPNELCSDGGRAINVSEPNWPSTLRGEAAEVFLRWERDLKPRGFHLTAQVLEFPGGKPGDIGLSLVWGE